VRKESVGGVLPVQENNIGVIILAIRSDGENNESSNLEFVRFYNNCLVGSPF